MMGANRLLAACALGAFAIFQPSVAAPLAGAATGLSVGDGSEASVLGVPVEKSASAQVLGSRATVTSSGTLFGGFEIRSAATVYILVRGNSLGTLGITQAYLDAPRVRVYNAQGVDLINDSTGRPGFNVCDNSGTFAAPVVSYYTFVRGQPPHPRDACTSGTLLAGVYTFSVTPSIPGVTTTTGVSVPPFGEVLFEVTLNP